VVTRPLRAVLALGAFALAAAAPSRQDQVVGQGASEPKRRIAIVRVEDRSGFPARSLGGEDAGSLAAAMLADALAERGGITVLKRGQLGDMDSGAGRPGRDPEVIGVNAFIYLTVTRLAVQRDSAKDSLSRPLVRSARAAVAARLIDPLIGSAFFSGSREAVCLPRAHPLFGASRSDSLLPKLALLAAVDSLAGRMAASLASQPWRAGILDVAPGKVVIAAGARAGLRSGQELRIVRQGKRIKEPSSGVVIELPGEAVGRVRVVSQFGSGDLDEGSVCALLEGTGITRADRVELEEEPVRADSP
jgi:hypothetical protein